MGAVKMGATGHDLHIDAALSQMAIGYRPEGFIADMLFPIVTVGKQYDIYTIFSRADRLRRQSTSRAPATEAQIVDEDVSSATYNAKNYALKGRVPREDLENADPIYRDLITTGKTQFVLDHLLLDWEVRIANQVNSTTNVGSSSAVSSGWTGSGADPLGDVNTGIDNVHYTTGKHPTDVAFGIEAWKSFRRHSTVRNIIFGVNNGGGYPSMGQVRELLEVERIHVAGAFQNTGAEGQAEALSTIWRDNVLIYYRPATPTRERPSFSYSFRWAPPGLPNMQVERHPYDTKIKAQEVEAGYYQDEVITGDDYGFLLVAVNSDT